MFAFLKLIPDHIWVYLALIAGLAGGFTWYTLHIEAKTRAADTAADQHVVDAKKIHNAEVEARAKTLTDAAVEKFKATLAAPPPAGAPHLLCRNPPRSDTGRTDGGAGPAAHADAGHPEAGRADPESAAEFDVGPALTKLHADADAWVTALQAYIKSCIDARICKAPAP